MMTIQELKDSAVGQWVISKFGEDQVVAKVDEDAASALSDAQSKVQSLTDQLANAQAELAALTPAPEVETPAEEVAETPAEEAVEAPQG